jgi:hypothetical protein
MFSQHYFVAINIPMFPNYCKTFHPFLTVLFRNILVKITDKLCDVDVSYSRFFFILGTYLPS